MTSKPYVVQSHAPHAVTHRHRSPGRWVLLLALVLVTAFGGVTVLRDPVLGATAVQLARDTVGPGAVATIEQWAFQAQDLLRQIEYRLAGARPAAVWAAPAVRLDAAGTATPVTTALTSATVTSGAVQWAPLTTLSDGTAVLQRAMVAPDPQRPYVQTALVRIDLRRAQLHMVAGTAEPKSSLSQARPGVIPAADQNAGRLLAAFNGGFRAVHGGFGMMSNGVTWLPPKPGLATVALYRDGRVRIGVWGHDVVASPDLIAFRQNCPLLIDNSQLTAQANGSNRALWGGTVTNRTTTWRSGLGLSSDARYLIYAAGDGLTVPALGQALSWAGASRGMQLDINSYYTRFETYSVGAGKALQAQKLLDRMAGDAKQYLQPYNRDFFYLVTGTRLA